MNSMSRLRPILSSVLVVGASAASVVLLYARLGEARDAGAPHHDHETCTKHAQPSEARTQPSDPIALAALLPLQPLEEASPAIVAEVESARRERLARDAHTLAAPGPWHEVEPQVYDALLGSGYSHEDVVQRHLGWDEDGVYRPDYSSEAFNPEGKEVDAVHRAHLDELASSFDPLLIDTAGRFAHELHRSLEDVWTRQEYEARWTALAPDQVEDANRLAREIRHGGAFAHVRALAIDGWSVTVAVDSNDYPALGSAVSDLRDGLRIRDRALREYVQALP